MFMYLTWNKILLYFPVTLLSSHGFSAPEQYCKQLLCPFLALTFCRLLSNQLLPLAPDFHLVLSVFLQILHSFWMLQLTGEWPISSELRISVFAFSFNLRPYYNNTLHQNSFSLLFYCTLFFLWGMLFFLLFHRCLIQYCHQLFPARSTLHFFGILLKFSQIRHPSSSLLASIYFSIIA